MPTQRWLSVFKARDLIRSALPVDVSSRISNFEHQAPVSIIDHNQPGFSVSLAGELA